MAEPDHNPVNTGISLKTLAPAAVRQLWKKGALVGEQSSDFFQQFEGRRADAPICTVTDTSKGSGQKITFTTRAGYHGRGRQGDQHFTDDSQYEKTLLNSFDLRVDWLRHGTSINARAEELMGMRGDIESGDNVELGKWLGRKKTAQMLGQFQLKLPSSNVIRPNGKTLDQLGSADTLDWSAIVSMGTTLAPLGGKPANVRREDVNGNPIRSNIVVATVPALGSLKVDPAYQTLLGNADNRGADNKIFKGGFRPVDGHVIAEYNPINHDGVGSVGSFQNPLAYLADPVAAGTSAIDITGGGADNIGNTYLQHDFFEYFGGYAYPFLENVEGTAFAPASVTRYFVVYNLTGTNAGKWGFYSYTTGNNGNKITIAGRLAAAAAGVAVTSLGGVTWSASLNTDAHPTGSLIIQTNAKGVPIGSTIMLGAKAAYRGYGKYRGDYKQQQEEGGFITKRYIWSVFGQTLGYDRAMRVPSVLRMDHAISYPGVNLPDVL